MSDSGKFKSLKLYLLPCTAQKFCYCWDMISDMSGLVPSLKQNNLNKNAVPTASLAACVWQ